MKTKHTNTKQNHNLKYPGPLASRPRSPAFRSARLLLCLLIISTAANASSQAGKKLPGSSLLIAKNPTTDSGTGILPVFLQNHRQDADATRKLWQARISITKSEEQNKSKKELRQMIELIRSIEIKQQNYAPKPVIAVGPLHQTEPNDTTSEPPIRKKPQEQQIQTELPSGPLSEKTMQILSEQLQHPEKLKNPFELGEILFQCGRLKEAAICYQQALARTEPNQADPNQNNAWTLLQIGNCLRNDEPPKAMEAYTQLLKEHPNSPWSDLAKARTKLISWYRRDNPRTLIDENRQPPADHEEANDYMLTTKQQSKTEQSKGG